MYQRCHNRGRRASNAVCAVNEHWPILRNTVPIISTPPILSMVSQNRWHLPILKGQPKLVLYLGGLGEERGCGLCMERSTIDLLSQYAPMQ